MSNLKENESAFDSSHTTYISKAESNVLLEKQKEEQLEKEEIAIKRRMERYATQIDMIAQLMTLDFETYKDTDLGDALKTNIICLERVSRDLGENFNIAEPRVDLLSRLVDGKLVPYPVEEQSKCYQIPRFTKRKDQDV